ncbi:hypothetical protein JB92DRAFT_2926090 [Gautieria morchelliformis]|nr:hypothetical protein JB92DRAFT_2926090 [Gautieria morchelliformis]
MTSPLLVPLCLLADLPQCPTYSPLHPHPCPRHAPWYLPPFALGMPDENVMLDHSREAAIQCVVDVLTCGDGLTSSGIQCGLWTYKVQN